MSISKSGPKFLIDLPLFLRQAGVGSPNRIGKFRGYWGWPLLFEIFGRKTNSKKKPGSIRKITLPSLASTASCFRTYVRY